MAVNSLDIREDRQVGITNPINVYPNSLFQSVVDFTPSPYGNELILVSKEPEPISTIRNTVRPFNNQIWVFVIGTFLVFGFMFIIFFNVLRYFYPMTIMTLIDSLEMSGVRWRERHLIYSTFSPRLSLVSSVETFLTGFQVGALAPFLSSFFLFLE